jgi:hypothetical protein
MFSVKHSSVSYEYLVYGQQVGSKCRQNELSKIYNQDFSTILSIGYNERYVEGSVQALKQEDLQRVLGRIEDDDLPVTFIFSGETTFCINGNKNQLNAHVWRTESPHVILEHERNSQKMNVFSAI